MSFTSIPGSRTLRLVVHSSFFTSSFLGGPSSKTMIPTASGTYIEPTYDAHPQQPSIGLKSTDRWKIERVIAVLMLAIIPSSFVCDSALLNYLLALSLAIHAHWGMDTVLNDYCPRKALPLANAIQYLLTVLAFVGLCYFNYKDMGLTKALKALWAMY